MKIFLLLGFFVSLQSISSEFIKCHEATDHYFQVNNIKLQVIERNNDQCMLSINAVNNYPKYRNYMFNTVNELIIFNSFDGGSPTDSTGARSYTFFTKKNELQFRVLNHSIEVKTLAGHVFSFSDKTGDLEDVKGMYYIFDEEVRGDNEGGLELHPIKGLILDEGWKQGELPRIFLDGESVFKDSLGQMCTVQNSRLFKHILDSRERVDRSYFLYPIQKELKNFLKIACPSIEY
ncbi:MAG: hypothetical protein HN576_11155 [Bacteriovoracaceae bacterium]|nr:hypothetical protein [Bacteriovoracaceae bacterium]